MNNLWEQSNIQANCDLCGVDEPFYMPVNRTDMMALRFQVPYHLVSANGGGLPIGANVRLYMVDEIGTTILCDMGAANGGKYMFGRYLDAPTKTAQYQFYMPVPFKDEFGFNYSHIYFYILDGQHVKISGTNTPADGEFTYGVDATPSIIQEMGNGVLIVPYRMPGLTLSVELDGVAIAWQYAYNGSTCSHENFNCFRLRLDVAFTNSGVSKTYYTKPFRVNRSCDDSVMLTGAYSVGATDCNGYVHDGTIAPNLAKPNVLFLRIPAVLNQVASRVKKTYNDKCFSVRGERQLSYRLNSDPVPSWFASEVENIVLANTFNVDNMELQTSDNDQLFTGVDIPGYQYQYLDVPLSSCKCLMLYGC